MRVLDLDPWVEILEAVLPDHQNGLLIRLVPDGDHIELGLLPLDGLHPSELLDGFVAPPEWAALGLVTRGWASPMDGMRPSQHPARRRIVGTYLLDRAGNTAGRIVRRTRRRRRGPPAARGRAAAADAPRPRLRGVRLVRRRWLDAVQLGGVAPQQLPPERLVQAA